MADINTTDSSGGGNGIADKVRQRAAEQLTSQKDRAFDGIGSVAQAVRQSTHQLRDQQHDTLAGYVEQAADQIDRFAKQLREKDVSELFRDAQRLARRQPALFVGSTFALGLLGARFLKSSPQPAGGDDSRYGRGTDASRARPLSSPPRYRGAPMVGSERTTGGSGVSPAGLGATPVASGSSYDSSSDGGASITPGTASGSARVPPGVKPDSSPMTSGRSPRSGSDKENA